MDQNVLESLDHIKQNIICINNELTYSAKCRNVPLSQSDDLDNAFKSMSIEIVLNNMEELSQLHSSIVTPEQKKYDILRYHMMHKSLDDGDIDNLDNAIHLTTNLLKLYHMRIGGFNLEDCEWNLHTNTSDMLFKLDKHTVLFSNSMRHKLVNDIDSISFVRDMTDCINRYLGNTITASWKKIYDDRKEINWIIIKLHKTESNEPTNNTETSKITNQDHDEANDPTEQ